MPIYITYIQRSYFWIPIFCKSTNWTTYLKALHSRFWTTRASSIANIYYNYYITVIVLILFILLVKKIQDPSLSLTHIPSYQYRSLKLDLKYSYILCLIWKIARDQSDMLYHNDLAPMYYIFQIIKIIHTKLIKHQCFWRHKTLIKFITKLV